MKKNIFVFLVAAPLFALLLISIQVYYSAVVWKYTGPETYFHIKPAETFGSINSRLANEGLISSARLFHRYSQYKGVMNKFKSGKYKIKSNSNLIDIFNSLINEKSLISFFTVPEGKNMFEIGRMLEDAQITTYIQFIALCKDPAFVKSLGIKGSTVEGYLYPNSYDFSPGIPAENVIRSMVKEFNKKTAQINFASSGMTKEEVITLASIVEKETGDKSERPMIAAVFLNRLNINMRLQSDPTTIYGMFETYNGNITRKDLLTPSNYNTYTLKALPVGPISNPGLLSIEAVLNPADHKYLYFVSANEGTHIFSETYAQHQEAVERWQKNAKNREGKSWRNKKVESPSMNAPAQ